MLLFTGEIRNVRYQAQTHLQALKIYSSEDFDVNSASAQGIIQWTNQTTLGYAKWVSPKRTRSYPFARLYRIYHLPKKVAIIPVIKDEGKGGDVDRINFITFSWMNLTNIFIILAWYDAFKPHPRRQDKITFQRLNRDYIMAQLNALQSYQQSALHWNTSHFEQNFRWVFEQAVQTYAQAETKLKIVMHKADNHIATLQTYLDESGRFSIDAFKQMSLPRSYDAAHRELQTDHMLEHLQTNTKALFSLKNMLGGEYHLTADEILFEGGHVIIQESKHATTDKLPKLADIHDGLFKLILFSNLDTLSLNGQAMEFAVRLKLTGRISGSLQLPSTSNMLDVFVTNNQLSASQIQLLRQLNEESQQNHRLSIQIGEA